MTGGDDRKVPSRRVQNWLTGLAAVVATGVQAQGMWAFFRDTMHIDNVWQRAASFAFLEIALLVCALRARTYRIRTGRAGVDDLIVWTIAALGGVLAASDAHGWAKAARIAAPLVAALLFERAISAERADVIDRPDRRIHWKVTLERAAVWLRLADAAERQVDEIDRARRVARLARLRVRAEQGAQPLRAWRLWRFRRSLAVANERLRLAVEGDIMAELRADLAMLYGAVDETTPAAVAGESPWAVHRTGTADEYTAGTPVRVPATGTTGTAVTVPPVRTDAELLEILGTVPVEADGTVPVRRAMTALGCSQNKATRLLRSAGLYREPVQRVNGTPVPALVQEG